MADFPDSTTLPEISRPILEAEIQRLIDILDQIDDDPDLETTGDEEPWLGAPGGLLIGYGCNWNGLNSLGNDDREEVCEDEAPNVTTRAPLITRATRTKTRNIGTRDFPATASPAAQLKPS